MKQNNTDQGSTTPETPKGAPDFIKGGEALESECLIEMNEHNPLNLTPEQYIRVWDDVFLATVIILKFYKEYTENEKKHKAKIQIPITPNSECNSEEKNI